MYSTVCTFWTRLPFIMVEENSMHHGCCLLISQQWGNPTDRLRNAKSFILFLMRLKPLRLLESVTQFTPKIKSWNTEKKQLHKVLSESDHSLEVSSPIKYLEKWSIYLLIKYPLTSFFKNKLCLFSSLTKHHRINEVYIRKFFTVGKLHAYMEISFLLWHPQNLILHFLLVLNCKLALPPNQVTLTGKGLPLTKIHVQSYILCCMF